MVVVPHNPVLQFAVTAWLYLIIGMDGQHKCGEITGMIKVLQNLNYIHQGNQLEKHCLVAVISLTKMHEQSDEGNTVDHVVQDGAET